MTGADKELVAFIVFVFLACTFCFAYIGELIMSSRWYEWRRLRREMSDREKRRAEIKRIIDMSKMSKEE